MNTDFINNVSGMGNEYGGDNLDLMGMANYSSFINKE